MFDDGAIKTERAFEEKIEALTTAKKVMRALRSPARIKEREDSTSVINSITVFMGLLQTLANHEKTVNALNVINNINEPTGHAIKLKLTLKTQAQFVYILVQKMSGVIQGVLALDKKDNNDSKTF